MRYLNYLAVPPPYHSVRLNSVSPVVMAAKARFTSFTNCDSQSDPNWDTSDLEGSRAVFSKVVHLSKCDLTHTLKCLDPNAPDEVVHIVKGMKKEITPVSSRVLLSVPQVCDYLSISKSTFYKWRAQGRGPQAIRLLNGDLRITEEALGLFMLSLSETHSR